jgi:hypothetical protein
VRLRVRLPVTVLCFQKSAVAGDVGDPTRCHVTEFSAVDADERGRSCREGRHPIVQRMRFD